MNRFSRDANKSANSASFSGPAISVPSDRAAGVSPVDSTPDEARRLLEEVHELGSRMRTNRRRAQQIDRRAAAYASRLARHTARLLQHMPNAVPAVRPIPGTGASSLRHYVLKHDQLDSPDRTRLLVVSSDGRIRICTVLTYGQGSRLWTDYEVTNPPVGLGLSVVFEGLSSLIVKLESAVGKAEQQSSEHEHAVDGLIAQSEARLAESGSLLAPMEERRHSPASDDLYGQLPSGELRSYGFEHRISFGGTKSAATETPPAAPTRAPNAEKPASTPKAPGRFAR